MVRMTFFLLIFVNYSCEKDEICVKKDLIRGEWIWINSYGGIGGETLTPENTMSTARLKIDKSTYREYENDSLILETSYNLTTTNDHPFSTTNTIIEFGNGNIVSVVIEDSELELIEQCFDCYSHKYERK